MNNERTVFDEIEKYRNVLDTIDDIRNNKLRVDQEYIDKQNEFKGFIANYNEENPDLNDPDLYDRLTEKLKDDKEGLEKLENYRDTLAELFRDKMALGRMISVYTKTVNKEFSDSEALKKISILPNKMQEELAKNLTVNNINATTIEEKEVKETVNTDTFETISYTKPISTYALYKLLIEKKKELGKDTKTLINKYEINTANCNDLEDMLVKYSDLEEEMYKSKQANYMNNGKTLTQIALFKINDGKRGNIYDDKNTEEEKATVQNKIMDLDNKFKEIAKSDSVNFNDPFEVNHWLGELTPYINTHALTLEEDGISGKELILNKLKENGYTSERVAVNNKEDYVKNIVSRSIEDLEKYGFFVSKASNHFKDLDSKYNIKEAEKTYFVDLISLLEDEIDKTNTDISLQQKFIEEKTNELENLNKEVLPIENKVSDNNVLIDRLSYVLNEANVRKTDTFNDTIGLNQDDLYNSEDPKIQALYTAWNYANSVPTIESIEEAFNLYKETKNDPSVDKRLLDQLGVRLFKTCYDKKADDQEEEVKRSNMLNSFIDEYNIRDEYEKNNNDLKAVLNSISLDTNEVDNTTNIYETTNKITRDMEMAKIVIDKDNEKLKGYQNRLDIVLAEAKKRGIIEDSSIDLADDKQELAIRDVNELVDTNSEVKDEDYDFSELDGEFKPIKAIKKISKELYEKISNSKFVEKVRKAVDYAKEHIIPIVVGTSVVAVAIVAGLSMHQKIENEKQNDDIKTKTNDEAINQMTEESTNEALAIATEAINNANSETKEEITPTISEVEVSVPTINQDVNNYINDVVNENAPIYSTANNASNNANPLNAYNPSWTNANTQNDFTYYADTNNDGNYEKVSEEVATAIVQDDGTVVARVDNNGTPIGFVPVNGENQGMSK